MYVYIYIYIPYPYNIGRKMGVVDGVNARTLDITNPRQGCTKTHFGKTPKAAWRGGNRLPAPHRRSNSSYVCANQV